MFEFAFYKLKNKISKAQLAHKNALRSSGFGSEQGLTPGQNGSEREKETE